MFAWQMRLHIWNSSRHYHSFFCCALPRLDPARNDLLALDFIATPTSHMDSIQVTLPDGSLQEVPRGTTPAEIARKISQRLAREALVARVDGELIDLSRPLEENASLKILTAKDPEALQVFRHSAAHLLAAAVLELFPDVKLGIGPPIDYGFFYEFLRQQPFTP